MRYENVKLSEVLQPKGYIRGPFGSALKRGELQKSGIPVYEQQHAITNCRTFRFYIGEEKYEALKRFTVQPNDIIISCSGTIGKVSMITEGDPVGIISQALLILRCNTDVILPRYLYYFLISATGFHSITSVSSGSVQVNIAKRAVIENMDIPYFPLDIQEKIVSILTSLDNKIELNQKINENLERQAQAIFKSWFVDFEPFIDEAFYTSPIGTSIPKSLKMQQISDIEHILETGKRPKGGATLAGIPSVGAENVKKLGQFDFSSNKYIPFEFAAKQKTGKIEGYELLLYKDGGKPGTFIPHFSMFGEGFPYSEFFINEHVFKLSFLDKGKNEFAYFYMQTDYVLSWLANNGGKAAIPGINQQNIRDIWIYDFHHPKIQEYCELVQPFFTKIFRNCYENMALAKIRDTLLPKLMSGEIHVEEVIL